MKSHADVIVVGAGAAGAAISWQLASSGVRVLCIEQGDFPDVSQYPSTTSRWELKKQNEFSPFPNRRRNSYDYPIDDSDSPISIGNFNGVGGATVLFSGHFPRMHPSDFMTKTLDGVGDDWPLTYSDLEPFFTLNDRNVGVSGLSGDPAYPEITGMMPPVPLGKLGEVMMTGFKRAEWHCWPAYSAIITRPVAGRSPCVNLGPCNLGCPQGAKSSADVTYWPKALEAGAKLITKSQVIRLVARRNNVIDSVEVRSLDGQTHVYRAGFFVVTCNGVGTPRLLLNSVSSDSRSGLANSSGLVGKNLMLHPLGYIEGIFEEDLQSSVGPQGCCLASHEFYETRREHDFKRGYSFQVLRGPGPVETAVTALKRRELHWGKNIHRQFADRFNRTVSMAAILEDLPRVENEVSLDTIRRDRNGMPSVRIKYKLDQNTRRMLSHALSNGRRVMSLAGAKKTYAFGPVRESGWHLMGTARMGSDPGKSVVDRYGKSHDVQNLYVADSSVFVTAGAVNPTSTLQAIALWIGHHLIERIGR